MEVAEGGNVEKVRDILRNNPNLNVIWGDDCGNTALHCACSSAHETTVSILLAHPDIDVNLKNRSGSTPFMRACSHGHASCARLLLKDQRVKVNEPNNGSTPLWDAAADGHLEVIRWWIASGREMDFGTPGNDKTDVMKAASDEGWYEVYTLLSDFKINPMETRRRVRRKLRISGESPCCFCISLCTSTLFSFFLSFFLFLYSV